MGDFLQLILFIHFDFWLLFIYIYYYVLKWEFLRQPLLIAEAVFLDIL